MNSPGSSSQWAQNPSSLFHFDPTVNYHAEYLGARRMVGELEGTVGELTAEISRLGKQLADTQSEVLREKKTKLTIAQRFGELSELCDQMRAQHHALLLKEEEVLQKLDEFRKLEGLVEEPIRPLSDPRTPPPSSSSSSSASSSATSSASSSASTSSPLLPPSAERDPEIFTPSLQKPRRDGGSSTELDKDSNKENIPPPGYSQALSPNTPTMPFRPAAPNLYRTPRPLQPRSPVRPRFPANQF